MAQRTKKQVDSNEVRQWANESGWRDELDRPVADRGRMPSGLIDAYNKANARYNREYVPIPRPVRADYREQAQAEKVEKSTARASRSTDSTPTPRASRTPARATATAAPAAVSAPVQAVATDEAEVREMEAALAAFAALPSDKKNGRPVIVKTTITALRYV